MPAFNEEHRAYRTMHRVPVPAPVARMGIAPVQNALRGVATTVVVHEEPFRHVVPDATVIPHGIERVTPDDRVAARRRLGLDDRLVALCFGFLAPYKGLETALEAGERAGRVGSPTASRAPRPRLHRGPRRRRRVRTAAGEVHDDRAVERRPRRGGRPPVPRPLRRDRRPGRAPGPGRRCGQRATGVRDAGRGRHRRPADVRAHLVLDAGQGGDVQHGYDAARTATRLAIDCDRAGRVLAAAMVDEYRLASEGRRGPPAVLDLSGRALVDHGHPVMTVGHAAAALANGSAESALDLLDVAERQDRDHPTYFGSAWVALGRLWLTTDRLGGCAARAATVAPSKSR